MPKFLFSIVVIAVIFITACSTAEVTPQFASAKDIPRISAQDAKAQYDLGAVMVDARVKETFTLDHIKNGINIPYSSNSEEIKNLTADLDKGKKYIFYCSCSAEQTSSAAAYKLNHAGFANVSVLAGGTSAWSNAGYPMEYVNKQ